MKTTLTSLLSLIFCSVFAADCDTLSFRTQIINASYQNNDGKIIISEIDGGTSPYTYNWSNTATTATIDGLSTGGNPYTVTITDANGCEQSACFSITNGDIPCTYLLPGNGTTTDYEYCGETINPHKAMRVYSISGATDYGMRLTNCSDSTDVSTYKFDAVSTQFGLCVWTLDKLTSGNGIQYGACYEVETQTFVGSDSSGFCWKDSCEIQIRDACDFNYSLKYNGEFMCDDTIYTHTFGFRMYNPCLVSDWKFDVIQVGGSDTTFYRGQPHNSFSLAWGGYNTPGTYKVIVNPIFSYGDTADCGDTCIIHLVDTSGSLRGKVDPFREYQSKEEINVIQGSDENTIKVKGWSNQNVSSVEVYDIQGRRVTSKFRIESNESGIILKRTDSSLKGVFFIRKGEADSAEKVIFR